jgi:hypothetical protein
VNIDRKLDLFVTGILLFTAAILGCHELSDPDIGWHLAGGLWMLDHGEILQADPLGAQGNFWWSYSWLPELVMALAFRAFDAAGLFAIQIVLALVFTKVVIELVREYSRGSDKNTTLGSRCAELLTSALVILIAAAFFHVRPQFLSLILFAVTLLWTKQNRLSVVRALVLVVFWVNIHVFWVLLPLVLVLLSSVPNFRSRGFKVFLLPFLCSVAALLNPYGWQHFYGLFNYVFNHHTAYGLIKEFSSLGTEHGIIACLIAGVLLLLAFYHRHIVSSVSRAEIFLAMFLLICGVFRIKLLAFSMVALAPLLVAALKQVFRSENRVLDGRDMSMSSVQKNDYWDGWFVPCCFRRRGRLGSQ